MRPASGLFRNAQQRACSRAPDPITRIVRLLFMGTSEAGSMAKVALVGEPERKPQFVRARLDLLVANRAAGRERGPNPGPGQGLDRVREEEGVGRGDGAGRLLARARDGLV